MIKSFFKAIGYVGLSTLSTALEEEKLRALQDRDEYLEPRAAAA
jgi:hypothetical protein